MMYYDLKENKPTYILPTGLMGFISHPRLVRALRDAGEIRKDEDVTHLNFQPEGLYFRVETKD